MTPLAYLQNALLVGAVFATYWLTESWWAWLWLLLWLFPSGTFSGTTKAEEDEPRRIITQERP